MVGIYELLGYIFYGTAKQTPDIPSINESHITGKFNMVAKVAGLSYGFVKNYAYMKNRRTKSSTRKIAKVLRVKEDVLFNADTEEIHKLFMGYKPKGKKGKAKA
jgi:hypothetical protein